MTDKNQAAPAAQAALAAKDAEIAALKQELENALALWGLAHTERSELMIRCAELEAQAVAP